MSERTKCAADARRADPLRALFNMLDGEHLRRLVRARLPPEDDDEDACLVHWAAQRGDVPLLQACLAADPSLVHLEGAGGQLPLHYAASGLQLQAVDALLDAGASAAALDWYDRTPAFRMASRGRASLSVAEQSAADAILARLVAAGMDIGATDQEGPCALMEAARNGNAPLVRLLLKHGASAELEGIDGGDLLCCSVRSMDCHNAAEVLGMLRRLLKGGAPAAAASSGGSTPLLAAAAVAPRLQPKHATALLQLLLQHGADATAKDGQAASCFHHLAGALSHPDCNSGAVAAALRVLLPLAGGEAALNEADGHGFPPLAHAFFGFLGHQVMLKQLELCPQAAPCLRVLMENGADAMAMYCHGQCGDMRTTAEHLACYAVRRKDLMRPAMVLLRILLDAGFDINSLNAQGASTLTTLLQYRGTNEQLLELLEIRCVEGYAEARARKKAELEELCWRVLDLLREWGACPNATARGLASSGAHQQRRGRSKCHVRRAARNGDARLLKWLIEAGADIPAADGSCVPGAPSDRRPLLALVWDGLIEDARYSMGQLREPRESSAGVDEARAHAVAALDMFLDLRRVGLPLLEPGTLSDSKAQKKFNDYSGGFSSWHDSAAFRTLRMVRQVLEGWQWAPERHKQAPVSFQDAARTLLLINRCRGFPTADSASGSAQGASGSSRKRGMGSRRNAAAGSSAAAEAAGVALPRRPRQQRQQLDVRQRRVSLEPELIVAILRFAGADMEPWARAEVASPRMGGWDVPRMHNPPCSLPGMLYW